MRIRAYRDADWNDWLRMSRALFPEATAAEHAADMRSFREREDAEVFVAERADGSLAGYVEVGARPYVDGCATSPVGYIEAWFVDADVRRAGVGRALLAAAEEWARALGLREMGSDALLDNVVSHEAHRRAGYEEVDRVVQFRKPLSGSRTDPPGAGRPVDPAHRALLEGAYAAFNARDIDAALAAMRPDVEWPNGMEGGTVHGHEAVREYWTRQWSLIDPRVEPRAFTSDAEGRVIVDVHQVVRDLEHRVVADQMVRHVYTFECGLVRRMEIREASDPP